MRPDAAACSPSVHKSQGGVPGADRSDTKGHGLLPLPRPTFASPEGRSLCEGRVPRRVARGPPSAGRVSLQGRPVAGVRRGRGGEPGGLGGRHAPGLAPEAGAGRHAHQAALLDPHAVQQVRLPGCGHSGEYAGRGPPRLRATTPPAAGPCWRTRARSRVHVPSLHTVSPSKSSGASRRVTILPQVAFAITPCARRTVEQSPANEDSSPDWTWSLAVRTGLPPRLAELRAPNRHMGAWPEAPVPAAGGSARHPSALRVYAEAAAWGMRCRGCGGPCAGKGQGRERTGPGAESRRRLCASYAPNGTVRGADRRGWGRPPRARLPRR